MSEIRSNSPSDFPTDIRDLTEAVHYLAATAIDFSDVDLGQPYRWHAHKEGVRFALLGTIHELRALAVAMAAERRAFGPPITRAQHALAQYNAAYRDLVAMLIGVTDEEYDQSPAPGEWPLRYVHGHMAGTQRHFFTLVAYALNRRRNAPDLPAELPDGETDRLLGPFAEFNEIMEDRSLADMQAFHAGLRARALDEFSGITDQEIESESIWWEQQPYTLEYRLHRFEAHLRQHTIQVEKTLDQIGRPANEARRLIRQMYNALAEVEAYTIGAPEIGMEDRYALAETITGRAELAATAVQQAREMIEAASAGSEARVRELLEEDPELVNAIDPAGVPVVRRAVYYGQAGIANFLADKGAEPDVFNAAALGRLESVKEVVEGWGDWVLKEHSTDGYTALQLACFFGHDEVARYLIGKGSDVNARSRNAMQIQPIHAAAAGGARGLVEALLDAGADPNAIQNDSFRALHSAAQNGDIEMARLLLSRGADPTLANDRGELPRDLALKSGHTDLAALL